MWRPLHSIPTTLGSWKLAVMWHAECRTRAYRERHQLQLSVTFGPKLWWKSIFSRSSLLDFYFYLRAGSKDKAPSPNIITYCSLQISGKKYYKKIFCIFCIEIFIAFLKFVWLLILFLHFAYTWHVCLFLFARGIVYLFLTFLLPFPTIIYLFYFG